MRRYLPDFHVADEVVSAQVTLRQCLNHSAGWVGDDEEDFGRGDDALARYIDRMRGLPQLTPPGAQFAYNNTALDVAGRIIEVVTGQTYEEAVRDLLLDPLGLSRTRYLHRSSWRATRLPAVTASSATAPSCPPILVSPP